MSTIRKFVLTPDNAQPYSDHAVFTVKMPRGASVLHVHEQAGEICLWAMCEPEAKPVARRFVVFPTGGSVLFPIGDAAGEVEYLGTAHAGALVWHVFEVLGG